MVFDFKKEYKEFYMPKNKPGIVTVPSMNYIAVRGQGDPNTEDGRVQAGDWIIVWHCFYHQDEQKRQSPDRRIL